MKPPLAAERIPAAPRGAAAPAGEPPEPTKLRVLYLEDNPDDAELCAHALRKAGLPVEMTVVDSRQGFLDALSPAVDVVLADYVVPGFGALEALKVVKQSGFDLPVIVVSGMIGEDLAAQVIQHGAVDYLLKDHLSRIGSALPRAIEERRLRRERAAAEQAIQAQDRLFRAVIENVADGVALLRRDMSPIYLSPAVQGRSGRRPEELTGQDVLDWIHPEDRARARQAFQSALTDPAQAWRADVRARGQDGAWRWVECAIDNHLDQADVRAVVVNVRDIDARRRAEEALAENEARYRALTENSAIGLYRTTPDGQIVFANPAVLRMLGFESLPDLSQRNLEHDGFEPTYPRSAFKERLEREGKIIGLESAWRRRDGTTIYVRENARVLRDERGAVVYEGTVEDITERKQAEQALRESEERFRRLAENARDMIYRYTYEPVRGFEYVSPAATAIVGYTPEEYYADPDLGTKLVHPDDRALLDDPARLGTSQPVRLRWIHKDGRVVWTEQSNVPIRGGDGRLLAVQGIARDITAQKQAEDALLRRSEEILLLYEAGRALGETLDQEALFDRTNQAVGRVMDCSGFYISTFDPESETIRCAYARHGGTKLDAASFPVIPLEAEGPGTQSRVIRSGTSMVLPDARAYWRTARTRFLVDASGVLDEPAADEADIYRSALIVPLKLEEKVTGVVQVFSQRPDAYQTDQLRFLEALAPQLSAAMANVRLFRRAQQEIGERRQAEQAMRKLSEFNEGLIHNMSEGIVLEEPDESFSFVNPAAAAMLGYGLGELVGAPLSTIVPPDQLAIVRAANARRAEGKSDRYELELVRKDGGRLAVLVSGSPRMEAGSPSGTIAVFTDISELKAAQDDLARRAELLQALYQTSLEINAQPDLQALLHAIVQRAAALIGSNRGGLYLVDRGGAHLTLVVSHNYERDFTGTVLRMGEGVSGRVAESGALLALEDYQAYAGKAAAFAEIETRRLLAVPLKVGDRVVGVLNVADDTVGAFSHDEVRLVRLFADQAAIAVENARLLEDERRRVEYLAGVTAASTALRAAHNRAEMLPIIEGQLAELLRTPHVGIALLDSDHGVEMQAGQGVLAQLVGMHGSPTEGLVGHILETGRTFMTRSAAQEDLILNKELFAGLQHVMGVPLVSQDRPIGAVILARSSAFSDEEVRLLTAIAGMAGNALNRAGVMETLEQRVVERTRDLEQANEQLQELDKLKGEFVSNVSHELRTPIGSIRLYLELLKKPVPDERRAEYMATMEREARRLSRLIEDLLALSRLDAGMVRLNLEPHLLDGLLAEVLGAHRARAEAKGLDLAHEPDVEAVPAWVSREQMLQVLTNLVGNAIAYTPPGGRVVVGALHDPGRPGLVGVRVWNSAPPISAEDLPHLFERFFRGQTGRASGEAGTGLGLAICKEIVERLDGQIGIESSLETGTTVTVWIPTSGSQLSPTTD